jgi:hypothetical protein
MEVDTETRQRAVERLVRAALVLTIGLALVLSALVLALLVGIVNILIEGFAGRVERTARLTMWLTSKTDRVMEWFMANITWIASGRGPKPDLLP